MLGKGENGSERGGRGKERSSRATLLTPVHPRTHKAHSRAVPLVQHGQESDSSAGVAETEDNRAHQYLQGQMQSSSLQPAAGLGL